jgi:hypothetical protein
MHDSNGWMTALEYFARTGLNESARQKFCQLGFIHPVITDRESFYSERDVEIGKAVLRMLDGKTKLEDAYKEALASLDQSQKAA